MQNASNAINGAIWKLNRLTPAGTASPVGHLTGLSRRPDTLEVFYTSTAGVVLHSFWYEGMAGWSKPAKLDRHLDEERADYEGGTAPMRGGGLAAASGRDGELRLVWHEPDGAIHDAMWTEMSAAWTHSYVAPSPVASFRLVLEELTVHRTTEDNILNDRDEVYFLIGGAVSSAGSGHVLRSGRIDPRAIAYGPEDYYGLKAGEQLRNIEMSRFELGLDEKCALVGALREQDNAQLEPMLEIVAGVSLMIAGAVASSDDVGKFGKDTVVSAAKQLYADLEKDGDETLGTQGVAVHRDDHGRVSYSWVGAQRWTEETAEFVNEVGDEHHYTYRMTVR